MLSIIFADEKSWHGDVKPDNILLVKGVFKLADFGFTKFKEGGDETEIPQTFMEGGTETYGKYSIDTEISLQLTIIAQVHQNGPELAKRRFQSLRKLIHGPLAAFYQLR